LRKLILVSSGLLFMIAAGGLVLIGSGEGDNMFVIMSSAAVPFLFTAYWNFFSVYYENRTNSSEGYFTYKSVSNTGIGVLYNKAIVVPFFLVLFGAAAIAVLTSFLVLNSSTEDAAIAAAGAGFLYSLVITIYFTIKICRGLKDENTLRTEKSADNTGFKIAFFFASFATLGLFPLIYFSVKYLKKKDANH
jgi:hypothetical protein